MMNTAAFRSPYIPWQIRIARTPLLGTLAIRGGNAFLRAALKMALEKRENMIPGRSRWISGPVQFLGQSRGHKSFRQRYSPHAAASQLRNLLQMEHDLPSLADRPWLLVMGDARLVLSRMVFATIFRFHPHGRSSRCPMPATGSSKTTRKK